MDLIVKSFDDGQAGIAFTFTSTATTMFVAIDKVSVLSKLSVVKFFSCVRCHNL